MICRKRENLHFKEGDHCIDIPVDICENLTIDNGENANFKPINIFLWLHGVGFKHGVNFSKTFNQLLHRLFWQL